MKKILLLLAALVVMASCTSTLPKQFTALADKVEKNGDSFSEAQWENANDQYEKLVEQFNENADKFNAEQKKEINAAIGRYQAAALKAGLKEAAGAVEELVEGAKGSGAMITVDFAGDQGRDVFAVPGSIYSPLSATPNRMIVDGANPVISPWEILEYYRWGKRPEASDANPHREVQLDEEERALVEPLREQELSFEELVQLSGFSAQKLNSHLTMLELRGIIMKVPGGMYRAYL